MLRAARAAAVRDTARVPPRRTTAARRDGPERQRPRPNPARAPTVLHEADGVLCVAKPAGVVTQPGRGHLDDTLLNGAFAVRGEALGALGADRDWGLLHRLDREVSGCVLLAETPEAYDRLRDAFERRRIVKTYLAIVQGAPPAAEGTCTRAIREEIRDDMKVALCPVRGGEAAETRWRTLGRAHGRSMLEVEPVTGRLHQIRVHLATLGCPIVGDRMYRADAPPNTSRLPPGREPDPLLLHAWRIEFPSPNGTVRVECPAPDAMRWPPAR